MHVITNGALNSEQVDFIPQLMPYIDYVHIREKNKKANELYNIYKALLEKNVPSHKIIINDRVDLAFLTQCAGVQLAYHSLPTQLVKEGYLNLAIGKSVHSLEEAMEAEKAGADYLLYGHIFESKSKPELLPKGLEQLSILTQSVDVPIIAIGGITVDNLPAIMDAGAKGVAVMSTVWEAANPVEIVRELHYSFTKWKEENIAIF